jgi:hypothetical protein
MLPSGTYAATLVEIQATFDQPVSTTRPGLNTALLHATTLIWARDAVAIIYVDGSYLTSKVDPVDVDVAVRSDIWDDTTFVVALQAAYPGDVQVIDAYFNRKSDVQHMEDLYRNVHGSLATKGIIQLVP